LYRIAIGDYIDLIEFRAVSKKVAVRHAVSAIVYFLFAFLEKEREREGGREREMFSRDNGLEGERLEGTSFPKREIFRTNRPP